MGVGLNDSQSSMKLPKQDGRDKAAGFSQYREVGYSIWELSPDLF